MTPATLIIFIAVFVLVFLTVVIRHYSSSRARTSHQLIFKPWPEERDLIINEEASDDPRPTIPVRPSDIDTRLPKKMLEQLKRDWNTSGRATGKEWEIYHKLYESIDNELAQINLDDNWAYEPISEIRRAVHVTYVFEQRVSGGGLDSYFVNHSGDGAWAVPDSFVLMDDKLAANFCREVNAHFPGGPKPFRPNRLRQMSGFSESDFDSLARKTNQYFKMQSDRDNGNVAFQAAIPFVLAHPQEFFKTD